MRSGKKKAVLSFVLVGGCCCGFFPLCFWFGVGLWLLLLVVASGAFWWWLPFGCSVCFLGFGFGFCSAVGWCLWFLGSGGSLLSCCSGVLGCLCSRCCSCVLARSWVGCLGFSSLVALVGVVAPAFFFCR